MKLRNKKTGEIKDVESLGHDRSLKDKYGPQITLSWNTEYENLGECRTYTSLAELNEEWEDYKEPDKFYYIDADGYIKSHSVDDRDFNNVKDGVENLIAIGNYFETEEEAEKAVKKLKARERLRRKGFRFTGYNLMNGCITFTFDGYYYGDEEDRKTSISDDLDFAFRR